MKILVLLIGCLAYSSVAVAADALRLALWVTQPIGAGSGMLCQLPEIPPRLPALPPTLTEQDVAAWQAEDGRWTLSPRFAGSDAVRQLQDRCFVLAIDGSYVSSGVVLGAHSARLTRVPTMAVYKHKGRVALQLTAGFDGSRRRAIHSDKLDRVLRDKPRFAPEAP